MLKFRTNSKKRTDYQPSGAPWFPVWMIHPLESYNPCIMQFNQPDSIIPEPYNTLDWNRYAYARGNPLRYSDPDGHNPIIAILIGAIKVISTAIDWGWTAYDTVNYVGAALDANNTPEVQKEAWGNAAMAIGTELIEPDEELSPVAVPLDDIARHGDDIAAGAEKVASQIHHFASNKHLTKWTAEFQAVAEKYGLKLDQKWNKYLIPDHKGRHPDLYHAWVLGQLREIATELGDCGPGCAKQFQELFKERVIDPVLENPRMLKKEFWD